VEGTSLGFRRAVQGLHLLPLAAPFSLYDPRGDIHVRTGAELRAMMAEVDRVNGELSPSSASAIFVSMNPDLMEVVHDPRLFEKQATLWAERAIFTLEVYHYRKPGRCKVGTACRYRSSGSWKPPGSLMPGAGAPAGIRTGAGLPR